MRDITHKFPSLRTARAEATLTATPVTIERVKRGDTPKGDPIPVAKIAAIQAAKGAPILIPYCHPIPIEFVGVEFSFTENTIRTEVAVKAVAKTGVEMEALAAASAAVLNLYDILKMIDDDMEIIGIKLLEKRGGKSDRRAPLGARVGVVVVSDTRTSEDDSTGPACVAALGSLGVSGEVVSIIPDEPSEISRAAGELAGEFEVLVFAGGTGPGPRDKTPEALMPLFDIELPGVAEAIRSYGQDRTQHAMLSRSVCGLIGTTAVLALPGSPKGAVDGIHASFPAILHAAGVAKGGGHEDDA
jgi:cyclic pyranopterin phosphate synthase